MAPSVLRPLALLALAGCGSSPVATGGDGRYVGTVIEFPAAPAAPGYSGRILIRHPDAAPPRDRILVHLGGETRIFLVPTRGTPRAVVAAELTLGDQVEVRTTGLELDSYPVQVHARTVHILR